VTQQWNASHKAANITLSGSPALTATLTTAAAFSIVFATEGVTTGKFYWEVTVAGTGVTDAGCGGGIGNTSTATTSGLYLGNATDSIGWYSNGTVYGNGGSSMTNTPWATFVTGNLLCFALDLVNNLFYGRVANGNWNASASANPATQILGVTIPSAVYANPVVPGATLYQISVADTAVAAFSQASWTYAAPAGFGPFDVVAVAWPSVAVSRF
jgi:hypothetical protein